MTENIATPVAPQPSVELQRVYLKDVSLEIPGAPVSFLTKEPVTVRIELNVMVAELGDGAFEVSLRSTLTGTADEKTLYVLEVVQAGIFLLQNVPVENIKGTLEVTAPAVLNGYLRVTISDLLARATLPAFFLPEINWAQGFAERKAQAEAMAVAANDPV